MTLPALADTVMGAALWLSTQLLDQLASKALITYLTAPADNPKIAFMATAKTLASYVVLPFNSC